MSRGFPGAVEVGSPLQVDAHRAERQVINILEGAPRVAHYRAADPAHFDESEDVLAGFVAGNCYFAPGDSERLRTGGPPLDLNEQQRPVRGPALDVIASVVGGHLCGRAAEGSLGRQYRIER